MNGAKKILWFLVTLVCVVVVSRFYLGDSFPYTHDGENHLARFANYKLAVREMQIPPRIAPVLHNHFGYPVFNYNYPLANIVSLPFSFLKISYQTTFALIVIVSLFGGAVGILKLVQQFTKVFGAQLCATVFWSTSPFIVSTLAFRGNIGEVVAYSLLPWMFYLLHWLKKPHSVLELGLAAALGTAFLLSHNITVVFALPLLAIYAALLFRTEKEAWMRAAIVAAVSVGASLWFWVPAVLEMDAVVVGSSQNQYAYAQHFVSIPQLLAAPLTFGYSFPGGVDSLGLKIGFLALFLYLVALYKLFFVVYNRKKTGFSTQTTLLLFYAVAAAVSFGLQLPSSSWLWETVPFLRFMQFPWRWSLFLFTFFTPLVAIAVTRLPKLLQYLVGISFILYLVSILRLQPVDTFTKTNIDYEHFTQTTSTQNENMATGFTFSDIGSWKPEASVLEENSTATIETVRWKGTHRIYTVEANTALTIVEPTMYFPGWETRIQNTTEADLGQWNHVQYTDSPEIGGRVAFRIEEPGSYRVESRFTQNTPARLVGNGVTLLTLVGGIGALLMYKKRRV